MESFAIPVAVALGAGAVIIGLYIGLRVKSNSANPTIHSSRPEVPVEEFDSPEISNDLSLLTIRPVFDKPADLEPLEVGATVKEDIRRLLEHTPRGLVAAAQAGMATVNTYIVVFSPKTMLQLGSTLEMVPAKGGGLRAIARGGSGFVEHGRLFSVSSINVACAAWQVLAIVTAQKFLSDINERLKSVETKLERIEKWLQHDRYGALKANLAYIEDILTTILAGRIQPSEIPIYRAELEKIDRECGRFTYASQADAALPIAEASGVQLSAFCTQPSTDRPVELIECFKTTARFQLMATHVRLAALRVSDALGADDNIATERTRRIRDQLQTFDALESEFSKRIEEKIASVNVAVDLFGNAEQTRQSLRGALQEGLREAHDYKEQMLKEVATVEERLKAGKESVILTIELNEDGSVKQISRMLTDQAAAAAAGETSD